MIHNDVSFGYRINAFGKVPILFWISLSHLPCKVHIRDCIQFLVCRNHVEHHYIMPIVTKEITDAENWVHKWILRPPLRVANVAHNVVSPMQYNSSTQTNVFHYINHTQYWDECSKRDNEYKKNKGALWNWNLFWNSSVSLYIISLSETSFAGW